MKQFILLVGNIGTGKTYYTKNYMPKSYNIIRPDDFRGDSEHRQSQMIKEIENSLENYETTVLDGPNLEKKHRQNMLYFTRKYAFCKKIIIDFGPGNENTIQRVIKSRPQLNENEWRAIHFENMKIYEKPNINEGFDEIIDKCNFA